MKIAGNVFVVLGLTHPYGVNAGFVTTEDGIVVIDSSYTYLSALTIKGYAEVSGKNKKFKYLILTEHHSDHIFGAKVFKNAGAEIIAHKKVKEFLEEKGRDYVEKMIEYHNKSWKKIEGYDLGRSLLCNVQFVLPDMTIEEEKTLFVGDEEIRLIPTPGHLLDCICVYLPKSKILFAGDTVYSGYPPTTRFGNKELWRKWIKSLKRLEKLEIEFIVPGHGRLCGNEEIEKNKRCLEELVVK